MHKEIISISYFIRGQQINPVIILTKICENLNCGDRNKPMGKRQRNIAIDLVAICNVGRSDERKTQSL